MEPWRNTSLKQFSISRTLVQEHQRTTLDELYSDWWAAFLQCHISAHVAGEKKCLVRRSQVHTQTSTGKKFRTWRFLERIYLFVLYNCFFCCFSSSRFLPQNDQFWLTIEEVQTLQCRYILSLAFFFLLLT